MIDWKKIRFEESKKSKKKLKVIKVSDFDSTIKLSLELSLEWKDSRIIISEKNLDNSKILTLNKNLLDLLWIPEIYIYDLHLQLILTIYTNSLHV